MEPCEGCSRPQDGSYGSGRFCSARCARSHSTKSKRGEINQRVSLSMRGRPSTGRPFVEGIDPRRRPFGKEDRQKAVRVSREKRNHSYSTLPFEELPLKERYRRVLSDQKGACLWCALKEWRGLPLVLEVDHINGDPGDNRRENLRYLCMNCHGQTPTFRNRKRI